MWPCCGPYSVSLPDASEANHIADVVDLSIVDVSPASALCLARGGQFAEKTLFMDFCLPSYPYVERMWQWQGYIARACGRNKSRRKRREG